MLGPQHLLPQDLVDVIDRGPPDEPFARPVRYRWHATDAKHALSVEPDRYRLVEHAVSAEPHQPGYSAVTAEMLANGFTERLRERVAASEAEESTPETSPVPASTATPVHEVAPTPPESPPWTGPESPLE